MRALDRLDSTYCFTLQKQRSLIQTDRKKRGEGWREKKKEQQCHAPESQAQQKRNSSGDFAHNEVDFSSSVHITTEK